jgi:cytochrome c-type biogenesis protein CcmH
MTLWLALTILCSAAAVAISIPLIRRYESTIAPNQESAVYQDQMNEVERDLQAGTINAPEAQSAKIEIGRRFDAVQRDGAVAQPLSNFWRAWALAASAGLVILGGVNLYGYMGSPNMPSAVPQPQLQQAQAQQQAAPAQQQAAAVPAAQASNGAAQVDQMITGLQAKLKANPNDAEGWRMLGWAMFNTQHFQESADAYTKALALDPANVDYKSALLESIVQTAQGVVTPKVQEMITDVLAKQPKDLRARFYDALGHEQSGDQQGALDRWLALLADAPADAGWKDDVKQRAADLAKALGKDVSAQVNSGAAAAPAPAQGGKPLAAGEKDAMVAGMIAKLAAKLDANPKDRDGWAMMIRSLIVTGDKKGADDALAKAVDIFKDDKATVDGLKQMAQEATQKFANGAGTAPAPAAPAAGAAASAIPPSAAAPQISADQQAAVQAMAPSDQQEMIKGMVQRLADKMKDNPKDMDGWMRLMRAYQVLKDNDKAKGAFGEALKAFDGDQASIDKLKAAATELGIN